MSEDGGGGFLSRWSKRKIDAKEGKPVVDEPLSKPELSQPLGPQAGAGVPPQVPVASNEAALEPASEPAPTLDDVASLTPESDFRRFAAPDVAPEVKNAALKKLFADPRYNVQDGLDVYIGDYSQPDPIPESMLRKLASAQFLKLFDEEDEKATVQAASDAPRDVADNPTAQSVAQSGATPVEGLGAPEHADPDLRLQQDDAAPGKDPGRGAG